MSLDRYLRQTIFAPVGEDGQRRLLDSRVVLVGCGATGTVLATYLARAGVGSRGMTMRVRPGASACFRCVFPQPPPPGTAETCDTAGVLGPAVGMVGALAAAEAIKLLVGDNAALNPGLIHLDAWNLAFQTV